MSQNINAPVSRYMPLPRGRHGLDIDELKAKRRARLLQAMLELGLQKGYSAVTVPEVVAAARVSRNAFYEFFTDKDACFVALCEEKAVELLEVTMAYSATTDWLTALRKGMRNYLRWWQEHPEISYAFLVTLPTLGGQALSDIQQKLYEPFENIFRQIVALIRYLNPQLPPIPERIPNMLVIAFTEILANEVRAGRINRLHELEDDLMYMAVRMLGSGSPNADMLSGESSA